MEKTSGRYYAVALVFV